MYNPENKSLEYIKSSTVTAFYKFMSTENPKLTLLLFYGNLGGC